MLVYPILLLGTIAWSNVVLQNEEILACSSKKKNWQTPSCFNYIMKFYLYRDCRIANQWRQETLPIPVIPTEGRQMFENRSRKQDWMQRLESHLSSSGERERKRSLSRTRHETSYWRQPLDGIRIFTGKQGQLMRKDLVTPMKLDETESLFSQMSEVTNVRTFFLNHII